MGKTKSKVVVRETKWLFGNWNYHPVYGQYSRLAYYVSLEDGQVTECHETKREYKELAL